MVKKGIQICLVFMMLMGLVSCDPRSVVPEEDIASESDPTAWELIQPEDLEYRGAFRLPDNGGGDILSSWAWGGYTMSYRPDGDAAGPDDGYPGSLFASGHAWEHRVAEVSIPVPVISATNTVAHLNSAGLLQGFQDVFGVGGWELPRVGLEFMSRQGSQSSDKLYLCWGGHLVEGKHLTHAWCEADLSTPRRQGDWYLDVAHQEYNSNDYLFRIPENWAAVYTGGRSLATGRYRDGGWSGQGPSIFAIAPWLDGDPPPTGAPLQYRILLQYTSSADNAAEVHSMNDYQHSDEWSGACWLISGNKWAVIFVGTKGKGDCWYGDRNGPCLDCQGERGWWSDRFEGQIIFYDPGDLAEVAAGNRQPWQPQPYAVKTVDNVLFHVTSHQQWYHVGAAAADHRNGMLYVLEPFADGDKPLVHVWKVR